MEYYNILLAEKGHMQPGITRNVVMSDHNPYGTEGEAASPLPSKIKVRKGPSYLLRVVRWKTLFIVSHRCTS